MHLIVITCKQGHATVLSRCLLQEFTCQDWLIWIGRTQKSNFKLMLRHYLEWTLVSSPKWGQSSITGGISDRQPRKQPKLIVSSTCHSRAVDCFLEICSQGLQENIADSLPNLKTDYTHPISSLMGLLSLSSPCAVGLATLAQVLQHVEEYYDWQWDQILPTMF